LTHGQAALCVHPSTPIDLVSGDPTWRAYQMRAAGSACGPEGKLFEPLSQHQVALAAAQTAQARTRLQQQLEDAYGATQ
jgi:hypothetical protein